MQTKKPSELNHWAIFNRLVNRLGGWGEGEAVKHEGGVWGFIADDFEGHGVAGCKSDGTKVDVVVSGGVVTPGFASDVDSDVVDLDFASGAEIIDCEVPVEVSTRHNHGEATSVGCGEGVG